MAVLVFVVDDVSETPDALATARSTSDLEIEKFYDGESALARATERSPDILITDIDMPGMDGITLARAIHAFNPHCEIVLMSGRPRAESVDAFAFMQKPFSVAQVLPLIYFLIREQVSAKAENYKS